jgi:hypothetical protein
MRFRCCDRLESPANRVAELTQVSARSVWRIAREVPPASARVADPSKRRVGRPSPVIGYTAAITTWLAEHRHLPNVEVLRRLQERATRAARARSAS